MKKTNILRGSSRELMRRLLLVGCLGGLALGGALTRQAHAATATIELLGTGTASLLGGDLTDPENDGDEAAGPDDASWNWVSIESNNEPGFEGGEFSYNVFDNKLGPGNDKWCCDDATPEAPKNITVEFAERTRLTHFTISSANDVPDRDPLHFQILGSNDGASFTPIYTHEEETSIWPERLQVALFTLQGAVPAYKFIRFECTYTAGTLYQLGEIEYFGQVGGELIIESLGIGAEALLGSDLTDPENDGDEDAGPTDPSWNWVSIDSNNEPGFGGGEFSFNIFDNKVGGGNDKWCCDDPSAANPLQVTVQLPKAAAITHFTMTSGNDTPDRDPIRFKILGSNDGVNFTPIYTRDDATSLWTERNEVIKITLAEPSPLYSYLRYEVTDTAGPLHQLNEIEYFGSYGGTGVPFVSGTSQTPMAFAVRVNDGNDTSLDPASAVLTVDGAVVEYTLDKVDNVSTLTYTPDPMFPSASAHTWALAAADDQGNPVNGSGRFTTTYYATLSPGDKVTPDTSKGGFTFAVHQTGSLSSTPQPGNNIAPREQQIAGLLGVNYADNWQQYDALALGTPDTGFLDVTQPVLFELEGVINHNQDEGGAAGNFGGDRRIPGIPGLEQSTDYIAGEIVTYADLPQGFITMGFNSDDGFETSGGVTDDIFQKIWMGEFDAGRGAADTLFTIYVQEAGTYALRTLWFEGGGGANFEWFTVNDGVKVLLNDTANGGYRLYRATTTPMTQPVITSVAPAIDAAGVDPHAGLTVLIKEKGTAITAGSIKLSVDGVEVATNASKNGDVWTATYTLPAGQVWGPGQVVEAGVTFAAGGTTRTETWNFTAYDYPTIPAALATAPGTGAERGLKWRTHQTAAARGNTVAERERQLAGELGASVHNTAGQGADGFFNIDFINFEQEAGLNGGQGQFQSANAAPQNVADALIPGIPGSSDTPTDYIAAECEAFIEFTTPGLKTMVVNSDDGFEVTTGIKGATLEEKKYLSLGIADYGKGASDIVFWFKVEQAGVYYMRLLWFEGDGGANCEWFTVNDNGSRALVNGTQTGSLAAYRTRTVAEPELPADDVEVAISLNEDGTVTLSWPGSGTLQTAPAVNGPWTDVPSATSPHTLSPTGDALFGRIVQ
ncbi:MAG: discoidin domain-containing protein [Verrucomicrobiales bacterium]|nr:discoidin domain-containing protein [Verrucomicrobiales bacterium]